MVRSPSHRNASTVGAGLATVARFRGAHRPISKARGMGVTRGPHGVTWGPRGGRMGSRGVTWARVGSRGLMWAHRHICKAHGMESRGGHERVTR
eukprot:4675797-Prymnesium_polylepis.1